MDGWVPTPFDLCCLFAGTLVVDEFTCCMDRWDPRLHTHSPSPPTHAHTYPHSCTSCTNPSQAACFQPQSTYSPVITLTVAPTPSIPTHSLNPTHPHPLSTTTIPSLIHLPPLITNTHSPTHLPIPPTCTPTNVACRTLALRVSGGVARVLRRYGVCVCVCVCVYVCACVVCVCCVRV